jgi:uncharacterized membrane protein YdjX (TVP38/TMEM64 family)
MEESADETESGTPAGPAPAGARPGGDAPRSHPNRVRLKLLLLILIVGGISLACYETGLFRLFVRRGEARAFIDALGGWGFLAFILLQMLQVIVAPLPGEVTGVLGGYLYGPLLGLLLSTIGLTLGSWIAFSLTRAFGRPFVERFVDRKSMERYDFLLHHKGAFLVFLIFLIPGFPKDLLTYVIGLGHLSTLEFLAITTTGRFLGTILLTLGGNFLRLQQYGRFFVVAGITVIVIFLSVLFRDRIEHLFRKLHKQTP